MMNRQERLDWLCRNVQPSEWGEHNPSALVALDAGYVYYYFYHTPVEQGFARTEYLARRVELGLGQSGMVDTETHHSQRAEPVHPDDMTPPFEGEVSGFNKKQESDMNIDIERLAKDRAYWDSVAPEDGKATHFCPDTVEEYAGWWINPRGLTDYHPYMPKSLERMAWEIAFFDEHTKAHAIPRPKSEPEPKSEHQWIDGLPPVGEVCQLWWGGSYQGEVEIIQYRNNRNQVIFLRIERDCVDSAEIPTAYFRPIHSPREAWVEKVDTIVKRIDGLTDAMTVAGYIHDALVSGELEAPK